MSGKRLLAFICDKFFLGDGRFFNPRGEGRESGFEKKDTLHGSKGTSDVGDLSVLDHDRLVNSNWCRDQGENLLSKSGKQPEGITEREA